MKVLIYEEKVKSLLQSQLELEGENIENDESLQENYGLDSMGFIQLVVALEQEFHIEFDDEVLMIQNFDTINKIVELVQRVKDG